MLKEFPHLLNPKNNLKAIDYINDWIKDIDSIIITHDVSIEELKQWKDTVNKTYGLEQLVDLQAKVSKLDRLEFGENGSIDLTKLITISDLFKYDEHGNIIQANIIPGNYEESNFEDGPIETYHTERIAITTPEGYLRGAMSFTGDDKQYLSGNGTWQPFPEISTTCIKKVTRNELIALRDAGELIPGNWYRITDYSTIVMQEGVSSCDSGIDIIILASAVDTLNENVYFTHSDSSDNSYLKQGIEVNINAWKGKYCIDNDIYRFSFVNNYDTFLIVNIGNELIHYARFKKDDTMYEETPLYCWRRLAESIYVSKNNLETNSLIGYASEDTPYEYIYTIVEVPTAQIEPDTFNYGYSNKAFGNTIVSSGVYDPNQNLIPSTYIKAVFPVSKGIIYYLEDEFGNNAPYDFKNIVFYNDALIHGFTFSSFTDNNNFSEASTLNNHTVYRNTINEYYTDFIDYTGQKYQRLTLNKIVMGCPCIDNYYGVNSHDIYIHGEARNNRWLGSSSMNKFTQNVIGNYFFTDCNNNTFTIDVEGNLFMGNCEDNNISLPDTTQYEGYSIDGIPAFKFNIVGSNFTHNQSTMPLIVGNTIGNNFSYNKLEANIGTKTNGSQTKLNALFLEPEYNFVSNTIGNIVQSNTISGLHSSSLGNNITSNLIKRFSKCTINSQVSFCSFYQQCVGLFLGGNNTMLLSNAIMNNTRISYGVSYIHILGTSLSNSTIDSTVRGKDGKEKEIFVENADSITYYSTGGTEIEV